MIFTNARIFTAEGYKKGRFRVEGGRFTDVVFEENEKTYAAVSSEAAASSHGISCTAEQKNDGPDAPVTDLEGKKVLPGLIDIHVHGAAGADYSDGDPTGLRKMAAALAKCGVTSFLPTSMTLPAETLEEVFRETAADMKEQAEEEKTGSGAAAAGRDVRARVLGIHMEGPFLSEAKKGAQNGAYLRDPDPALFTRLQAAAEGLIRTVCVAPELPGALSFIREASRHCTVSLAHTAADYETAARAFEAGASHLTHLFNAMPGIHHRAPGVIGAAAERKAVFAELIADGIHVHPSAVRMAFSLFPGRIVLVSDAVRLLGLPEGSCMIFGGQEIILKDGAARLFDGSDGPYPTIAGAATSLFDDMKNVIRFGIPETEAILSATERPAASIGLKETAGRIAAGGSADFLVCSEELDLLNVFVGGEEV